MSDRIVKEITLKASRARVWKALVDREEFGTWFRVAFPAGPFREGEVVRGQITYPGYEHMSMDIEVVEVVELERLIFRWQPGEEDTTHRTTVSFTLSDAPGGTRLVLVESGFDALPAAMRETAFRQNERGWTEQMRNIESHVVGVP